MNAPLSTLRACAVLSFLISANAALAQPDTSLPRRAWLGAALEAADGGVRVREVMSGSSAESAGIAPGDVIKQIASTPTASVPEILAALRAARSGASVDIVVERDATPKTLKMTLKEWPREAATDAYEVEYGLVATDAGRLRTITFVPKTKQPDGKQPALLIIQGLGAATLDNPKPGEPVDQPTGMAVYRTLADALARDGYVVMRVDKGGCGDSEGDPTQLDFVTELAGYRNALQALKARPDVNGENVFLFGHSMGGVFGPLLAAETPVKGLAAYGTCLKTWIEYLAENHRRQALLAGANLADYDRLARGLEKFNHELLVDKKSPRQILEDDSKLTEIPAEMGMQGDLLFGRHYQFFQQLNDVNLPEAWSKHKGHALALWGEAEFVTGRDDHEQIAAIINELRPGQGEFQVVKASDHGFGQAATPLEALQAMQQAGPGAPSRFNPEIVRVLRNWMQATLAN